MEPLRNVVDKHDKREKWDTRREHDHQPDCAHLCTIMIR